jgi:hypothetical protein
MSRSLDLFVSRQTGTFFTIGAHVPYDKDIVSMKNAIDFIWLDVLLLFLVKK